MGFRSLDDMVNVPRCARCGRDVDSLDVVAVDALVAGRVYTAHCHGDREVSILRDVDLLEAIPGSFRYGLAFTTAAYRGPFVMRGAAAAPREWLDVDPRDSAFAPLQPAQYEPRSLPSMLTGRR